jgi:chorismatase
MRVEQNDLGSALLMLGGTASVVGEDTLHPHSLSAQIAETLRNLAALVGDGLRPRSDRSSPTGGLESVTQLRVYYVEDGHFAEIDRAVTSAFKGLCELDYVRTALCRDDLLVEMEGLARLAVGPRARVA